MTDDQKVDPLVRDHQKRHSNILSAIEARDATAFLRILDEGIKEAALAASAESHALTLSVADGEPKRRDTPGAHRAG